MAEFVIKVADERGRVQEQVQTAATAEELRTRFVHAGYHVFYVRPRGGFGGLRRAKVNLETFLIYNQQFLTLIRAGLPILGSIQMLAKNQKNAHFAAQLEDVAARVKTGDALSAAFEAQSGFPVMYTTTLLAGERSGNLQEVLERYVSFQRTSLTFRKKLVASLIYPGVLLALVFLLMGFMFVFVIPQFAQLYDEMGSKLPAMTIDLLAFGKFLNRNLLWIVLIMAGTAYGIYRFSITERGRDFIDGVRVRLPIFGKIWLKYQVALVCAHAFHAADGRIAAGAFAGDRGPLHQLAPRFPRGHQLHHHGARGAQPGRCAHPDQSFSRPGRRDDLRGRADRRLAADAQLRVRVF
jgi:type IV pilus assembly protein PilC